MAGIEREGEGRDEKREKGLGREGKEHCKYQSKNHLILLKSASQTRWEERMSDDGVRLARKLFLFLQHKISLGNRYIVK